MVTAFGRGCVKTGIGFLVRAVAARRVAKFDRAGMTFSLAERTYQIASINFLVPTRLITRFKL